LEPGNAVALASVKSPLPSQGIAGCRSLPRKPDTGEIVLRGSAAQAATRARPSQRPLMLTRVRRGCSHILSGLVLLLALGDGAARSEEGEVVFSIDFSDYSSGPVLSWLEAKALTPEQDIADEGKILLTGAGRALGMQARSRALGLLLGEMDVPTYSRIRLEWGVEAFPPGASYEKGVRSDAVMVYVFFGSQKLSSGSLLVPNSPYFLGLYLCDSDRINYPYVGRYFKLGGRYVCIDRTKLAETRTSEYDLADAFLRFFERDELLAVSGIGIGIDTKSAKGDGSAKGFIRRIEFLR
jgi:hypothetical protein